MNIVICTHYYRPHVGGIEIVAENHAQRLAALGHDVTVLTTAIDAPRGRSTRDGYEVVRYEAFNPLEERGMPYPVPNPVECRKTVRHAVDESVDLLHVHGLNYLTSLVPVFAAPTTSIPVVLHQHTPFVEYSPLLDVIEHLNDRIVGGTILRYADHCIGVSNNVSAYVSQQYDGPVTTLFNGVDTDRFRPDVTPTAPEFLYLGRLTQKKGIDRLLETAAILEKRETETTIRIAGGGTMQAAVKDAANRLTTVEYEGFVDAKRLPELYSGARALLVPKLGGDAFPTLTILEALASGTPSVFPQTNQSAPGFVPDETYVQTQASPTGLADTVEQLVDSPSVIDRLSNATRALAVNTYDWEKRVDELEEVYATVRADGNYVSERIDQVYNG